MNQLMLRLEGIADETGDADKNAANKRRAAAGGDEFARLRHELAVNVRAIRQQLKEREELLSKGTVATKHTVQISHRIRQQIKQAVRATATTLRTLVRACARERGAARREGGEESAKTSPRLSGAVASASPRKADTLRRAMLI